MDAKLANDLAQAYGDEFNQQEEENQEDEQQEAQQEEEQQDSEQQEEKQEDGKPPVDSAARFTLEDVERISANAAAIAVERARVPVQPHEQEEDLDKVIASKFEYGTDRTMVKAAVEIAEERAYNRFVRDFGHMLEANQGRVAVKEVRRHVEVDPELEPYIERATEEYGLKVTGPLDPKQARAIRALARDLYEDSGSRQEGAARKKVVSTRAVDNSERGTSNSNEYRLTPDDDAFEKAFGSGMAKTIRKQRGEL